MLPALHLTANLHEDELVLTVRDGTEYSRLGVDDEVDAAEALALLDEGALPVRLLWSHEELDAALIRHGYARTTPWSYGPTADVVYIASA